ncbi:MAG: 1-acyl-sn-glycerol-3-phosphate acyltransferase [Clostridia bacterium]|nr:1-acyl-sn-glycerol-3-phosphate acyltransferase [Clostridia bacterium]
MKERFYKVMRVLLGAYYAVVFPATVEGLENIPAEGAFILCCNHCSNRDPFYLGVFIRQRFLYFMAKIELFRFWPVSWFVRSLGGFPVDRGHSDLNAVRTALKLLKEGQCMAIFPQGTRIKDNSRTPMLEGASMIALRAGAPVIPAYIGGPYRPFRRTQVSFGKPVDLSDFSRKLDSPTLVAATRRIEDAVWALKK